MSAERNSIDDVAVVIQPHAHQARHLPQPTVVVVYEAENVALGCRAEQHFAQRAHLVDNLVEHTVAVHTGLAFNDVQLVVFRKNHVQLVVVCRPFTRYVDTDRYVVGMHAAFNQMIDVFLCIKSSLLKQMEYCR